MKRSLTIGCVLLVGGGVSQCGGNAQTDLAPDNAAGEQNAPFHFAGGHNPNLSAGDGGESGASDDAAGGHFFVGIPK